MANLTVAERAARRQIDRLFRKHFGVKRQIAREAGVSESSITRWLKGSRVNSPDVEIACRRKQAELLCNDSSMTAKQEETRPV